MSISSMRDCFERRQLLTRTHISLGFLGYHLQAYRFAYGERQLRKEREDSSEAEATSLGLTFPNSNHTRTMSGVRRPQKLLQHL